MRRRKPLLAVLFDGRTPKETHTHGRGADAVQDDEELRAEETEQEDPDFGRGPFKIGHVFDG